MANSLGRWARAIALVGVIALALMSIMSVYGPSSTMASMAYAGPAAANGNGNGNNGDQTSDDNNEERVLQGQVIQLREDHDPPQALVATLGEDVWANLYNDQLHRSGVRPGDHVHMQGEYNKGVFDAYQVDVQDRCCPGPNSNNNNGDGNGNANDNN
jgi:hypothetical protein